MARNKDYDLEELDFEEYEDEEEEEYQDSSPSGMSFLTAATILLAIIVLASGALLVFGRDLIPEQYRSSLPDLSPSRLVGKLTSLVKPEAAQPTLPAPSEAPVEVTPLVQEDDPAANAAKWALIVQTATPEANQLTPSDSAIPADAGTLVDPSLVNSAAGDIAPTAPPAQAPVGGASDQPAAGASMPDVNVTVQNPPATVIEPQAPADVNVTVQNPAPNIPADQNSITVQTPALNIPPAENNITVQSPNINIPPAENNITVQNPALNIPAAETNLTIQSPALIPPADQTNITVNPPASQPSAGSTVIVNPPSVESPDVNVSVNSSSDPSAAQSPDVNVTIQNPEVSQPPAQNNITVNPPTVQSPDINMTIQNPPAAQAQPAETNLTILNPAGNAGGAQQQPNPVNVNIQNPAVVTSPDQITVNVENVVPAGSPAQPGPVQVTVSQPAANGGQQTAYTLPVEVNLGGVSFTLPAGMQLCPATRATSQPATAQDEGTGGLLSAPAIPQDTPSTLDPASGAAPDSQQLMPVQNDQPQATPLPGEPMTPVEIAPVVIIPQAPAATQAPSEPGNQPGKQIIVATSTVDPNQPQPTATQYMPPVEPAATGTVDPDVVQKATLAAQQTQIASGQPTLRPTLSPTPTALPKSGFADDVGLPGLLGLSAALVTVIFLARRLRA